MVSNPKQERIIVSVEALLNYIVDTGEKPVSSSNAPGGPRTRAKA
jgi:hypothetical protein